MSAGRGAVPLTLGTAGHIDHGKTALVRVLTGRDTDRLPEEHERGISIELGYAPLELPSGRRLSLIDVPGHERFVRTMVAGATGLDLFLLCVAADDGVMPQTREHLAVLRQLGVERGVAAITKADLTEPGGAVAEVAELVPGVQAIPVSAQRGDGIRELLRALERVSAELPGRAPAGGPARLHVDRSFTLRGIGTVVTGTLWSGELAVGDTVQVLPRGLRARVRSLEVHDARLQRAAAGQRVALALAGVSRSELGRGDVVCGPGAALEATWLIDAAVSVEAGANPLRRGERLHVHHGTREVPARVAPLDGDELRPGERGPAQLRLESPLVPAAGDRFVLRRLAPPETIGGGTVLDPRPRKHGGGPELVERLRAIERGEAPVSAAGPEASAREQRAAAAVATADPEPLDAAALRLAELLEGDGEEPRADGDLAAAAGLQPGEAAGRFRSLEQAGRAVRTGRNLHFNPEHLGRLTERVVAICEREGRATLGGVRDELGTSRRYAQALLEHLDAERVTRRDGDAHVLRRARAE